ncbi:MAG TPA: TfoX/Sxy family protein [Actinomycetota bacterium]
MKLPKPDEASRAYFESLVPDDPRVKVRPMFGNLAAFVNGNMFLSLFGSQVSVRLSDQDRAELLQEKGTGIFEPMPGRPMKEYVSMPSAWRDQTGPAQHWVERSLRWAASLPPKKK